ncbi:hypothetical protein O6H91_01G017100 [Diphasiastrum complanatum]|uniref:Uncharacterized protein n=1 Tax=Diphasiastrum complanatum TaxID=34168 RepID=A0ACC2ENP4_DIPCM|nr:hypothetical protein O6H91_01G017100 [Diphasiastrum complanatum]
MERGSPNSHSVEGDESSGSQYNQFGRGRTFESKSDQRAFFRKSPTSTLESSTIALLQQKLQQVEREKEMRLSKQRQSGRSPRTPDANWWAEKSHEDASSSHQVGSGYSYSYQDDEENESLKLSLALPSVDSYSRYRTDAAGYGRDDDDVDTSLHL